MDVREIIGRAIAEYEYASGGAAEWFEKDRADFLQGADEILAALKDGGFAVVGVEPKAYEAMLAAAQEQEGE